MSTHNKKQYGSQYFVNRASNILKNHGLKFTCINNKEIIIVPIKSYNLATKEFTNNSSIISKKFSEYEKAHRGKYLSINTDAGTINPEVKDYSGKTNTDIRSKIYEDFLTIERTKLNTFLKSLHKEKYWEFIPSSYKSIILKNINIIINDDINNSLKQTGDLLNKLLGPIKDAYGTNKGYDKGYDKWGSYKVYDKGYDKWGSYKDSFLKPMFDMEEPADIIPETKNLETPTKNSDVKADIEYESLFSKEIYSKEPMFGPNTKVTTLPPPPEVKGYNAFEEALKYDSTH